MGIFTGTRFERKKTRLAREAREAAEREAREAAYPSRVPSIATADTAATSVQGSAAASDFLSRADFDDGVNGFDGHGGGSSPERKGSASRKRGGVVDTGGRGESSSPEKQPRPSNSSKGRGVNLTRYNSKTVFRKGSLGRAAAATATAGVAEAIRGGVFNGIGQDSKTREDDGSPAKVRPSNSSKGRRVKNPRGRNGSGEAVDAYQSPEKSPEKDGRRKASLGRSGGVKIVKEASKSGLFGGGSPDSSPGDGSPSGRRGKRSGTEGAVNARANLRRAVRKGSGKASGGSPKKASDNDSPTKYRRDGVHGLNTSKVTRVERSGSSSPEEKDANASPEGKGSSSRKLGAVGNLARQGSKTSVLGGDSPDGGAVGSSRRKHTGDGSGRSGVRKPPRTRPQVARKGSGDTTGSGRKVSGSGRNVAFRPPADQQITDVLHSKSDLLNLSKSGLLGDVAYNKDFTLNDYLDIRLNKLSEAKIQDSGVSRQGGFINKLTKKLQEVLVDANGSGQTLSGYISEKANSKEVVGGDRPITLAAPEPDNKRSSVTDLVKFFGGGASSSRRNGGDWAKVVAGDGGITVGGSGRSGRH